MTRRTTIFLVAALAFACGKAEEQPAEVSDAARTLLTKAIECMGGDAALAKVKGMRLETKGTYQMSTMPMAAPYTSEIVYVAPDRHVWRLDAVMFKGAMGIHGETAWSHWMGPPARVTGAMLENMKQMLVHHQVMLVRPLLHLGGAKITGVDDQVQVVFPDGTKYTLTFSAGEACFLTGFEGDMTHWDGRKGTLKSKLTEPKAFGDLTMPSKHEMQTFIDGELQETMQEEMTFEWNPTVDDKAFSMPAHELELMKATVKDAPEFQGVMIVHEGAYDTMGDTIKKIYKAVQDSGLMAMGNVTAVFLNDPNEVADPGELRTEVYMPVMIMGPVPESMTEGAVMKTVPGAQMASMSARGPYGEADVKALGALMSWVGENGYEVVGPPRTVYMHHPEMT
ncbi:MAG: GyrI-like domain-containing protein, partial [Planctomycetota bacterium]